MVELLHSFVDEAINAGEFSDITPGFKLDYFDGLLHFSTDNGSVLAKMTNKQADHVAFVLDRVAYLGGVMNSVVENGTFQASRQGPGISIGNLASDGAAAKIVVTLQVARNLARQIRNAINKAGINSGIE